MLVNLQICFTYNPDSCEISPDSWMFVQCMFNGKSLRNLWSSSQCLRAALGIVCACVCGLGQQHTRRLRGLFIRLLAQVPYHTCGKTVSVCLTSEQTQHARCTHTEWLYCEREGDFADHTNYISAQQFISEQ